MTLRRAARVCAVVLALTSGSSAWSNGDLFFEAMEIPGKPEYVIFGSVKDGKGKYVVGAYVTVKVGEPRLSYTSETGMLGRFRSLDIGRAIRSLGYEVDPSRIEVEVEYPGHKESRRLYRGKRGQKKGAVEINFVLEKESKSP